MLPARSLPPEEPDWDGVVILLFPENNGDEKPNAERQQD
jgi:hypothetical protein